MHKIKLFILFSFFICNHSFADEHKTINISDAWISEAPPTVSILAAYAKIQNSSDKEKILTAISSPSFSMIELHLSNVDDGIAKMEKQDSLSIPANESIELSPGSYHLMLFTPEAPLKAGDTASLTFSFADGSSKTVEAIVKKRDVMKQSHDHEHSHEHHHDH
jgi:copper(I)-binding protein